MKSFRALFCVLLALALLSTSALAAVNLKKGDRNAWVAALQLRLNELGYSVGTADGDFGGKTTSALQKYQTEKGLPVTGEADDATWAALYDEYVTLKKSGNSSAVCDVKLTEPFYSIAPSDSNDGSVDMRMDNVVAHVAPVQRDSLERAEQAFSEIFNDSYENAVSQYQASDNVITSEYFDAGGEQGVVVFNRFNLVNGAPLTHYVWLGVIAVDPDTMVRVELGFNITERDRDFYEALFTNDVVKSILAGIQPVGQEGVSAASGYEPVGDVNISDLLPLIQKYVDADAGYGSEMTDEARVCLYYGAKAMDWFYRMQAAGNAREDVLNEARLEIVVGSMDSELRAQYGEISQKYISMLLSLTQFPEEDVKAVLAEMGIPDFTPADSRDIEDMLTWGVDGFTSVS